MTKNYLKLGALVVFAIIIVGGLFLYTDRAQAPTAPASQTQSGTVSLSVQGLYASKQVSITQNETVLQVLQSLNTQDPQLKLMTKDYPDMGVLITGMNGVANGADKKYWQYKVNTVAPQIGADQYKLKSGDAIEWFFGASQE